MSRNSIKCHFRIYCQLCRQHRGPPLRRTQGWGTLSCGGAGEARSKGGPPAQPLLEKREKWRTPSYFGQCYKDKPALYFPVEVAHLPVSPIRFSPVFTFGSPLRFQRKNNTSRGMSVLSGPFSFR